jgi:large subunit ribosomal protein L23
MITCYDIIKSLIRTEKGTSMENQRKYQFYVAKTATKIGIKGAVEEIYKVKVSSVHTMIVAGKPKRVRHQLGYASDWKKAIVTLKEGSKIETT